ncbi:hypothetical protein D3C81_1759720 [compost metagenome]
MTCAHGQRLLQPPALGLDALHARAAPDHAFSESDRVTVMVHDHAVLEPPQVPAVEAIEGLPIHVGHRLPIPQVDGHLLVGVQVGNGVPTGVVERQLQGVADGRHQQQGGAHPGKAFSREHGGLG